MTITSPEALREALQLERQKIKQSQAQLKELESHLSELESNRDALKAEIEHRLILLEAAESSPPGDTPKNRDVETTGVATQNPNTISAKLNSTKNMGAEKTRPRRETIIEIFSSNKGQAFTVNHVLELLYKSGVKLNGKKPRDVIYQDLVNLQNTIQLIKKKQGRENAWIMPE